MPLGTFFTRLVSTTQTNKQPYRTDQEWARSRKIRFKLRIRAETIMPFTNHNSHDSFCKFSDLKEGREVLQSSSLLFPPPVHCAVRTLRMIYTYNFESCLLLSECTICYVNLDTFILKLLIDPNTSIFKNISPNLLIARLQAQIRRLD